VRLIVLLQVLSKLRTATQLKGERQVVVAQPLAAHPLYQAPEDGPCDLGIFNGAAAADGAAYALGSALLVARRDEPATKRARRILPLVLLAVARAPVIHEVFAHQRLAAIGAARSNALVIALDMVRRALMHLKTGGSDRASTGSAYKMFWMPGGAERSEVMSVDRPPASFTYRLS